MSADIRGNAAASVMTGNLKPGEHLRAEIERLALDQVAVSKATGVSRQSINNIVNGRQTISRAMAGKLGRLTGHSSDYWLRQSFSRDAGALEEGVTRPFRSGVLVNHQILRAVKDGIIGIDPFVAENVQPASIILTLHDIVTTEGQKIDGGRGKGFLIKAGHAVSASTKERIGFPRDYIGRIGAVSGLGSVGIVMSHAFQIEPGFNGRLRFCLFNAGGRDHRLRKGDPIAGLEIVQLGGTPD